MSLISAVLTVPAYMVPGGLPKPDPQEFGFLDIKYQCINSSVASIASFSFSTPTESCNEKQFDKAIEKFLWFFAKGTSYSIRKTFSDNQPDQHYRYRYVNNRLICENVD